MFNLRLKELRQQKGITKKKVASILKIDQSTYGKYELGHREPSFDMLTKIADYFDVSTDYLLGKTDVKKASEPEKTDSEAELDALSMELMNLLIKKGVIKEGEDLTPRQGKILISLIDAMEALRDD